MTMSSLCTYKHITSNSSSRNGVRVRKITPHYMAARWTGRQCADYFASTTRQASSNYCIGVGGDIAMSVDEDRRAWTSSNGANDRQAITIECGNLSNATGELSDATWESLVALCADICRRYGITLTYTGTSSGTLTEHRMFASTDCPGPWLHARMGRLASEVNARVAGASVTQQTPSRVEVDGWVGPATTRLWQHVMGTTEDGVVSGQTEATRPHHHALRSVTYDGGGSRLVRAVQSAVGAEADGYLGPATIKVVQSRLGVDADGYFGNQTARALQERLNTGTF